MMTDTALLFGCRGTSSAEGIYASFIEANFLIRYIRYTLQWDVLTLGPMGDFSGLFTVL